MAPSGSEAYMIHSRDGIPFRDKALWVYFSSGVGE